MVLTKLHLNEKKSMSSPVINVPVFSLSILLLAIVAGIAESGDFKSFSLPIHSFTFGDIWNLIRPYIFLSYKLADDRSFLDSLFGKGINDVKFIVGWIFILHQIQALLIFAVEISFSLLQITEEPTEKIEGDLVAKPRLTEKIAEQFYLFFFYLTTFTTGYMVYAHSEYYPLFVNSSKLWSLYPNSSLSPIHKAYYLIQASFWLHELVKLVALTPVHHRKKDHYPMIVHHIVTSSLLLLSYSFHFTSIGTVVLITFDIADLLLSVAKILKYGGPKMQLGCDVMFGTFFVTWLGTRHGVFFYLMWSVYYEYNEFLTCHKWEPWWDRSVPDNVTMSWYTALSGKEELSKYYSVDETAWVEWMAPGKYCSTTTHYFFLFLFAILQGLLLFWFYLICKVVVRVVTGVGANDNREDDD